MSLARKLQADLRAGARAVAPHVGSFREFLEHHGRCKISAGPQAGQYAPYSFAGREALLEVCRVIDLVIGSHTGKPLKDSTVVLAGGAQFGKTVLELHLMAYLAAIRFLNPSVYLPDDQLAADIVDAKFRPDVVDQIPWFAEMTQLGRSVNKSGKAVNTKGAFIATDGTRRSVGMFRGLRKVPTSFTNDVVIEDEKDDIPPSKAKYLSGRMTASALRLSIVVGTQRVHGAGQNKAWADGSQGIMLLAPADQEIPAECLAMDSAPECPTVTSLPPGWINPEEAWPQICRLAVTGTPRTDDPVLTYDGDFKRPGTTEVAGAYTPDGVYYLAHPDTGQPLDRHRLAWLHKRPERIASRRWTFRVAQIGAAAIDLGQIVAHWGRAVADPEEMTSFLCDRLARPKSTAQALTPEILERARRIEVFQFGERRAGRPRYAGLDTGDRCWFSAREIGSPTAKRMIFADKIALADVVSRTVHHCQRLGIDALFIDARPAVTEARTLCLVLNGLADIVRWPMPDDPDHALIHFPGGLVWDGPAGKWRHLKCAAVEFTKRQIGSGITHKLGSFTEDGQVKFYPIIQCNRFEAIDAVITELLTPEENVFQAPAGKLRQDPALLLPQRVPGAPGILETLDAHLLTGSQRAKEKDGTLGDYVDECENHLLLSAAYARLAEQECAVAKLGGGITSARGIHVGSDRARRQFRPRILTREDA